jgi:hypothetical protein
MTETRFTATDRTLARFEDTPDLPPLLERRSKLIQVGSPENMTGDMAYVSGISPGDFLLYAGDERIAIKGAEGWCGVLIGAKTIYVEYGPNRGTFIAVHEDRPDDAEWRDGPDGRRAILRDDGNRIEETVNTYWLITGVAVHPEPFGTLFPWRSTGVPIGHKLVHQASQLRTTFDGEELHGPAIGKWRLTSFLEKSGDYRWFKAKPTLIGRIGEPSGPTLPEWRLATRARMAFKNGLDWEPANLPPLPAPKDEQPMSRRRRAAAEDVAAKAEPEVDQIPW